MKSHSKAKRFTALLLVLCFACMTALTGCKNSDMEKPANVESNVTNKANDNKDSEVTATPTVEPTQEATVKPTQEAMVEPTETKKEEEVDPETAALLAYEWPEDISLCDAYKDDFYVGTIYTERSTNGKLYDTLVQNFNIITPENLMKPENMQRTEGKFNFTNSDAMMAFAADNNLMVHGHTLAWHQQSGNWLGKNVDRDTAIAQLKSHITNVVSKYKGQIYSWDVVNEAINDGVNLPMNGDWTKCLRKTQWLDSIGPDYLAMAFQFAHEADPDAVLYYNDYNLNNPQKAKIVNAMVKDFLDQGVPIGGIGMQGHYNTQVSLGYVEQNIKMFSELGVKISITELDVGVNGASGSGLTKEQEVAQAIVLAKLFKVFKTYRDSIERVTFWGHVDTQSWRSNTFPCLFNGDYSPKEAVKAVYNPEAYLAQTANGSSSKKEETKVVTKLEAKYGTPEIDGEIDDVWKNAKEYDVKSQLTAWEGATGTVKVLWDEKNVYVLMNVKDNVLNKASANLYEQDSVELYLDQNNKKTDYYDDDDGQYRVNYEGFASFGTVPTQEGFQCGTKTVTGGYVVEVAIPLLKEATVGTVYGFEAQVNDANATGMRQSVAKLSDLSDNSYQSAENWAEVTLVK